MEKSRKHTEKMNAKVFSMMMQPGKSGAEKIGKSEAFKNFIL